MNVNGKRERSAQPRMTDIGEHGLVFFRIRETLHNPHDSHRRGCHSRSCRYPADGRSAIGADQCLQSPKVYHGMFVGRECFLKLMECIACHTFPVGISCFEYFGSDFLEVPFFQNSVPECIQSQQYVLPIQAQLLVFSVDSPKYIYWHGQINSTDHCHFCSSGRWIIRRPGKQFKF